MSNIILKTDSCKCGHWKQYPRNTSHVFSYFESRNGAKYDKTVFFSLQYILRKYFEGRVVTPEKIEEARSIIDQHLGEGAFNAEGWYKLLELHNGRLPLRIRSVPEGLPVPVSNVLMTVENTDPRFPWLPNYVESILTHVWYGSTVATASYFMRRFFQDCLEKSSVGGLPDFMLHDFGYRGVNTDEGAEIGGAAHLISFKGTDTVPALKFLQDYYGANEIAGYSVPATEHSVMTILGESGEPEVFARILQEYPEGILSVVSDSYNIYRFVSEYVCRDNRDTILARNGVFVVRPDSVTKTHQNPKDLVVWILRELANAFGFTVNSKGYAVLNPKVRVIWGDGLSSEGIQEICHEVMREKFSVENLGFGQGGGLLQKVNRDVQRFAFKASWAQIDGVGRDIFKNPIDSTKQSKKGRLTLVHQNGEYRTEIEGNSSGAEVLTTQFLNGGVFSKYSLDDLRLNTGLTIAS